MIAALLISLGGLVVALAAPYPLAAMLRRLDPRVTFLAWAGLVGGTTTALLAPLALSLAPGHGGMTMLSDLAQRCLLAVRDALPARLEAGIGLAGLAVALTTLVRFVIHWRATTLERRHMHDKHLDLYRLLHHGQCEPTLWLPLDTPLAYSLAGSPAIVVASEGLRAQLDPMALAAVLAHERAHVRRRHHLLVAIAEAVSYAIPWLPLTRRSPELVRALVELDADRHAAHEHGAASVRRALMALGASAIPASALGIAQDCVELRLARLADDRAHHHAPLRTGAAMLTVPILPVLVLVAGIAFSSCSG